MSFFTISTAYFFHAIISILVFFIIYEIIGKRNVSLISALIFAAHPIHTGRVTNITAGCDLLGIFFMLFSFYFYIKFPKLNNEKILIFSSTRKSTIFGVPKIRRIFQDIKSISHFLYVKKYFFFSLLLFLIAIFSSEEAIVLPLLVVLYEFTFNREQFKKAVKNCIPYFIIGLFFVVIRFFVLGIKGRLEEYLAGNFFLTMLTMLKVYVYYIYLLIVPVNLTLYRDVEAASSIFDFRVLISLFILATIIFFTLKNNKNKIVFFSVFWFFIALIPFSNIVPIQNFMADRYLYVPSIAFSLLFSYLIFSLFNEKITIFSSIKSVSHFLYNNKIPNFNYKNIIRYGVVVFIVLLLGFYVFSTVNRNNDFRNNLTLWGRTIETNPDNSRTHDNLGFTFERSDETKKALEEFELAVKLQPDNFRALANLGVAYAKLGLYNKSINALQKSIEIRKYHKTYDKLGLVYVEVNEDNKAIESLKEAIKINQRYAKARNDLATVYGTLGEFDLALLEFHEAIRIDKDYADAHYNLGILLEFLDEDSSKEFEIAFKLEPENELYGKKIGR